MMSDIKRYSPIGGAVTLEFDGHYVKYSDHEKQLSTMREALEFYADADNYYDAPSFVPLVPLDGGEKAKKALESDDEG